MAAPELPGLPKAVGDLSLRAGAFCTANPVCGRILNTFIGVKGSQSPPKPTSNEIGDWGVREAGTNLPIDIGQIRRIDPVTGQIRKYDGAFRDFPNVFTEIKTSLNGTFNAREFIRNQVNFDANMVTKPIWIFINSIPSGPLGKLLMESGISYIMLNVPKPPNW